MWRSVVDANTRRANHVLRRDKDRREEKCVQGRRRERTEATQNDEDEMQNRLHKVPGSAIIAHRDWSDLEKAVSEGLGHLRTCFESGTLAENRCHRTWLAGWLVVSVARDEFRSVFFLAATTRSYVIHERRNLTTKPKQSCEPRTATSEVGRWKYFWDNPTISSIITKRNRKLFFFDSARRIEEEGEMILV